MAFIPGGGGGGAVLFVIGGVSYIFGSEIFNGIYIFGCYFLLPESYIFESEILRRYYIFGFETIN